MALALHKSLRSTTLRLAGLVFITQLLLISVLLIYAQNRSREAFDVAERIEATALHNDLINENRERGRAALIHAIDDRLTNLHDRIVVLLLQDRQGRILAGNLGAWPTVIPDQTQWHETQLYRIGSRHPELVGVTSSILPDGSRLLAGHVISYGQTLTRIHEETGMAALLLSLPLSLLVAFIFAQIINSRISALANTAADVANGRLTQRVALNGSGDSFDRLGQAINFMLDRISALMSEMRMVTDGLAHDLRSPITRLKSVLERAAQETDDAAALNALEKVGTEAEILLSMLTMAMMISRAEAGIGRDRFKRVSIDTFLTDLVEVYGPLAEDEGFTLTSTASPDLAIPMDRALLGRSIGNLIENALKYAKGGTRIVLSAERNADGSVRIEVADDGPGIRPEERAEALRRFGRLDPARHQTGSGLGLSLVEAVAVLHGGRIQLEDNQPGLRVVLTVLGDN